jgi:hypothetical protein
MNNPQTRYSILALQSETKLKTEENETLRNKDANYPMRTAVR